MSITCSVIIASNSPGDVLVECLDRLVGQGDQGVLEIIVADSSGDGTAELVETRFPMVKLLRSEQAATLAVLRGRAIAMAGGQVIAILDPWSMVAPDWLDQLLKVHEQRSNTVIGGAVDLHLAEAQGILSWARYFNEYGMFMSPFEEGAADILPGCNISYKRECLFDGDRPLFEEFWKTFINADAASTGQDLWLTPNLKVELAKPIGYVKFLATRFLHGRCYAGMRCADAGPVHRLIRFLTAPLLPLVLQYRWSRRIWPKKRYRGKFILSLPFQLSLFACWSLGEMTGYLAGSGTSCRKLYY